MSAASSSGRGTQEHILASSAGCGSILRGAVNSKFSGENRSTQNLLGSLKTTRWLTAPASESLSFFSLGLKPGVQILDALFPPSPVASALAGLVYIALLVLSLGLASFKAI